MIAYTNEETSVIKKSKAETEEVVLEMLKEMVGKVKADIESEKKEREEVEVTLLNLLESTVGKMNQSKEEI